jgi:hypothetical protein
MNNLDIKKLRELSPSLVKIIELKRKIANTKGANRLLSRLKALKAQLAEGAQKVYDLWQQNEENFDEEWGQGGICQDIADIICDILIQHDIDCQIVEAQIGEQHVWAVAYDGEYREAYNVDIPPDVYELGSGYKWTKRKDIKINPYDIIIEPIDYEDLEF